MKWIEKLVNLYVSSKYFSLKYQVPGYTLKDIPRTLVANICECEGDKFSPESANWTLKVSLLYLLCRSKDEHWVSKKMVSERKHRARRK